MKGHSLSTVGAFLKELSCLELRLLCVCITICLIQSGLGKEATEIGFRFSSCHNFILSIQLLLRRWLFTIATLIGQTDRETYWACTSEYYNALQQPRITPPQQLLANRTALYFPILYRYITAYTTSTAQLHSELVRYRPTRNSSKAGFYAFSTSKKSSVAVCETVLASINH